LKILTFNYSKKNHLVENDRFLRASHMEVHGKCSV
jgi:hypothetical protein